MSSTAAISADLAPTRRWRPRVTHARPEDDLAAAVHAAADLLAALGLDLTDHGARTTTSALFGRLRDDPRSRAEFLALTRSTP